MNYEYEECKRLMEYNFEQTKSTYGFPTFKMFYNTPLLKEIKTGEGVIFNTDMGL